MSVAGAAEAGAGQVFLLRAVRHGPDGGGGEIFFFLSTPTPSVTTLTNHSTFSGGRHAEDHLPHEGPGVPDPLPPGPGPPRVSGSGRLVITC